jgi:hypothetical protein
MVYMSSNMLARRIRSIQTTACSGHILRCLKVIHQTIHNLQTCKLDGIPPVLQDRCVSCLYVAAMYANQENREAIIELMYRIYEELDDSNPTMDELPHSVRKSIEHFV